MVTAAAADCQNDLDKSISNRTTRMRITNTRMTLIETTTCSSIAGIGASTEAKTIL